ncbi:glycoside hydrolase family 31 protein [Biscogniauxia mediterranea]|nr:glycoside hydrolase family 31 protein [Biscogniauxia mediterranea]
MLPSVRVVAVLALAITIKGTQGASSTVSVQQTYSLLPQVDAAPSLTPTIYDSEAPDPQKCPGYKASNVIQNAQGVTADLTLAGPNCQAFGTDIENLVLEVQYQTKERLNVKIYPKYLSAQNTSHYILPSSIVPAPSRDGNTTISNSDLKFDWSNSPSFQFKISRSSNGEELFSTYGHVLVYENQFLEVVTNMVQDYNVYGLAENIHDFYLGQNYTQTFWNSDAGINSGNPVDGNIYGVHPFYQESRYHPGSNTTSHGVYARNAHGQEWLLRNSTITYRTLGGSFDFYFLSGQNEQGGSTAVDTIRQYHSGCVGLPAMQMFWTLGFHQCRLGYTNLSLIEAVVDNYKAANIPLEGIWSDFDMFDGYRSFVNNPVTYPVDDMAKWIDSLHKNNQYYVPLIWTNIYRTNPTNASDAYGPYDRGAELETFIRNPNTGDFYNGNNWPGFVVWGDYMIPSSQAWWTNELVTWWNQIPFDGILSDLSEPASYCVGSCGDGKLDLNPVHVPLLIPGEYLNIDYEYPEGFSVRNSSDVASVSQAAAAQSSALQTTTPFPSATTTTLGRTEPTPGLRNLTYPPYVLNNVQEGHALVKGTISPDATHNDPANTTEYEMHNLFGYQAANATYHALLKIFPGRRPFGMARGTFAGSGRFSSHWGGDNTSTWGSMFLSISHALTHMMAGIPMFGVDACGYTHNTDFDLCSRWMALAAFFPFYRNQNIGSAIAQEAYVWSSVAEASRRAMAVRYSLLNYMYTLLYQAHTKGDTVVRALAWEFPNDETLKTTYSQFLLGPSILVTPVLTPNTETVRGVFPGIGEGTRWYDWYTLEEVHAKPQENVTLSAPLEHINVHARGGSVFTLQEPGYTTTATRNNPFSLLATLDDNEYAEGTVYLDDGVSLEPNATKIVSFTYSNGTLQATASGTYHASAPLANITIAGLQAQPQGVQFRYSNSKTLFNSTSPNLEYSNGTAYITGLAQYTPHGAFEHSFQLTLTH